MLLPLLISSSPTRLVVGIDHPDLGHIGGAPLVEALLRDLGAVEVTRFPFAVVLDVTDVDTALRHLTKRPGIRWVEEDKPFPVVLRLVPDDPRYPEQWALHITELAEPAAPINVEAAWDQTTGQTSAGNPVRVAVVDDGIDTTHTDLIGNIVAGKDIYSDDDDPTATSHDTHGTQTAGVIAARGFNGIGITGVCPTCEISAIRLIANGGPSDLYTTGSSAAAAIQWAVDHGAAVINNSWGPPDGNRFDPLHPVATHPIPRALADALHYAATQGRDGLGTVVVWSAGNGNEPMIYDGFASDPRVIAVGSISAAGVRAYYSDFGPPLGLVAPSSGPSLSPGILTTDLAGSDGLDSGDYFDGYGGTSAAAAFVSGVAALVIAHRPELTAAQVTEALYIGAHPIDPQRGQYVGGKSQLYGHGRVDAAGALAAADLYTDAHTLWLEVCGNDADDNHDGLIDAEDNAQCTPCVPDHDTEICDGRDNNCDGFADEYFVCDERDRPVCAPCASSTQCAVGSKCRSTSAFAGTWCFEECTDGDCAPGFSCDGEVCGLTPSPAALDCFDLLRCGQPERCDAIDNDCNGVIDDIDANTLEAGIARRDCGTRGVCRDYAAHCIDGDWQCERHEHWQALETRCDGLDNDCDGKIDEHSLCEAREQRLLGEPEGCQTTSAVCNAMPSGLFLCLVTMKRRWRRRAP